MALPHAMLVEYAVLYGSESWSDSSMKDSTLPVALHSWPDSKARSGYCFAQSPVQPVLFLVSPSETYKVLPSAVVRYSPSGPVRVVIEIGLCEKAELEMRSASQTRRVLLLFICWQSLQAMNPCSSQRQTKPTVAQ